MWCDQEKLINHAPFSCCNSISPPVYSKGETERRTIIFFLKARLNIYLHSTFVLINIPPQKKKKKKRRRKRKKRKECSTRQKKRVNSREKKTTFNFTHIYLHSPYQSQSSSGQQWNVAGLDHNHTLLPSLRDSIQWVVICCCLHRHGQQGATGGLKGAGGMGKQAQVHLAVPQECAQNVHWGWWCQAPGWKLERILLWLFIKCLLKEEEKEREKEKKKFE